MIITKEWLDAHKTGSGAYTRKQLHALGQSWPPSRKWQKNVIGLEIPISVKQDFESGKYEKASKKAKNKQGRHYVYFVQSGRRGAIKIGYARDVDKRVNELQIGNPFKLRVVALMPCESLDHAKYVETKLHKRFKSHKIRGEWFKNSINFNKAVDENNPIMVTGVDQAEDEQRRYDLELITNNFI
jgi:predicted GIY-YIG superfamily endonuclease